MLQCMSFFLFCTTVTAMFSLTAAVMMGWGGLPHGVPSVERPRILGSRLEQLSRFSVCGGAVCTYGRCLVVLVVKKWKDLQSEYADEKVASLFF